MQKEDIYELISSYQINHIYLNFVDINGNLRSKTVGTEELKRNRHVSWEDGVSINSNIVPLGMNSDEWFVIVPDSNSYCCIPKSSNLPQSIASVLCFIKDSPMCSRQVLQNAVLEAESNGFRPMAGLQLIYTFDNFVKEKYGYSIHLEGAENTFNNKFVEILSDAKIGVEYYFPYPNGFNRVDFIPCVALEMADKYTIAKWLLDGISSNKVLYNNDAGLPTNFSSCPMHFSFWNRDGNKNLFYDPKDNAELSKDGYMVARGILKHSEYLSAIVAATSGENFDSVVNKFRIEFSSLNNPGALIQIPRYYKEQFKSDRVGWSKRLIYNGSINTANIHLVLAGLIYAGLDGLNCFDNSTLPAKHDTYMAKKFGKELTDYFLYSL